VVEWTERDLTHREAGVESLDIGVGKALLLVPVPNDHLAVRSRGKSHKLLLLFVGAEVNRHELFGLEVPRHKYFLGFYCNVVVRYTTGLLASVLSLYTFQKATHIVDGTDGLGALLADSKEFFGRGEGHGGYALGAFEAGDEPLGTVVDAVEDNVMAAGIDNDIVVEEKEVALDVLFKSKHKLGHYLEVTSNAGRLVLFNLS
jgi:hypothetical protein